MKFITILSQILLITSSFACANTTNKNSDTTTLTNNTTTGFAVVELFTSEGCSSCPPADAVVAKLLKTHNSNVYVLGYHVDYWNNLGWKDIFSNAAYTQIQKYYAATFKLSSIYTPQVVINGTEQFVGSNENKLNAAVNNDLQQSTNVKLTVDALANNKIVTVNYSTDATNAKLKIALVQLSADNQIKRGENSGATLHHVNIVRDIQTVSNANGKVMLNIPSNLSAKDFHVIAFTQNTNNSKITAATEVSIQ